MKINEFLTLENNKVFLDYKPNLFEGLDVSKNGEIFLDCCDVESLLDKNGKIELKEGIYSIAFFDEETFIFEFSISVYSCLVHVYGIYIDSDGMKRAEGKGLDFSDLIPKEQVVYF